MKVSSKRVLQGNASFYYIDVTDCQSPGETEYARRELLAVAGAELEEHLRASDIVPVVADGRSFLFVIGSSYVSGTGFNPMCYENVVPVEDIIGKFERHVEVLGEVRATR